MLSPRRLAGHLAGRLARDQRGVSAVEFALIAPFMVLLYFGMAETSSAVMASRHTSHAASTLGDLVAQSAGVSASDLTNLFEAADDVMAPFDDSALLTRVTSVTMDSNKTPRVDWSCVPSGQSGLSTFASKAAMTLPANLEIASGDSMIRADAQYQFTSPATYLIKNGITFNVTVYYKPRTSAQVTLVNGSCP